MGCGASTGAAGVATGVGEKGNGPVKMKDARLTKINSQLGKKSVVNSFVVKKGRDRRRTHEGEADRKITVERDVAVLGVLAEEPEEPSALSTIMLPAESGILAAPSFHRPASSALSFKMPRGLQEKMLSQMKSKSQLADLATYKQCLYSDDPKENLKGASYIREQLSVVNPPVAAIRASGILPRLIALLANDKDRELQYEVAWTITNICSAEHEDCQEVVDQGAVPQFVRLLDTCDDATDVLEQAIWALGNVAADCADLQRYCLDEEVVKPLLGCIARNSEDVSVLRHAMWLLSNLSRPKPQGDELLEVIPTLMEVITTPDQDMEVATHACWALAYMTSLEDVLDDLTEGEGAQEVLAQLVSWISAPASNLTAPALRVLGNMCSGSTKNTQAVLDAKGLQGFITCLKQSHRMAVKKEIVWSLSNVAAGNNEQVQALLDVGAFAAVAELLSSSEETLARECAYVLANPWAAKAVPITTQVAQALLDAGMISVLIGLLKRHGQPGIVMLALDGLSDALKKGQQMMREQAKDIPLPPAPADVPEGEEPPPPPPLPTNPVAAAMKAENGEDVLQGLFAVEYDGLAAKASALLNMLKFM